MRLAQTLAHLLLPRESNNHKARLLHNFPLFLLISLLFLYQVFLQALPRVTPQILGYAANISPAEVINLTNQKRQAAGLAPLKENSVLSQAAQAKGADMLNKGYWAHVAPDGTQPWKFFADFNYKYRFAGENLARDFSNPASAVEAWMASVSHRENLLSPKYKEIGVAVVEGNLAGVETTIIVQFFGTKLTDTLPVAPVAAVETAPTPVASPFSFAAANQALGKGLTISPFNVTRAVSLGLVSLLIVVLLVDSVIVSRRKILRIGGRPLAHLAFFGMILAILLIVKAGRIL